MENRYRKVCEEKDLFEWPLKMAEERTLNC